MNQNKRPYRNKFARSIALIIIVIIVSFIIYHQAPIDKIPDGVMIDSILVRKSDHKLYAFSGGKLMVTYTIAIGRHAIGAKEYEGDKRTPEGTYTINDRNARSGYHKNLGISYPNDRDRARATALGKPTGGDIKIHGLENGKGYIGKFHRWRDWTNGCIALSDEEVDELYAHVPLGTPIIIEK